MRHQVWMSNETKNWDNGKSSVVNLQEYITVRCFKKNELKENSHQNDKDCQKSIARTSMTGSQPQAQPEGLFAACFNNTSS